MIVEYLIGFSVFLLLLKLLFRPDGKNRPPGPIRWPFIGNTIEIALADPKYPHIALSNLAKKYGEIMTVGLGVHETVVVSSYEAIKEVMVQSTILSRYPFPFVLERSFGKRLGILFGSGVMWRDVRKFTMKGLANFGFGKGKSMESEIRAEAEELISNIKKRAEVNNGIYEVDPIQIGISLVSTLWTFIGGQKIPKEDDKFKRFTELSYKQIEVFKHNNIYTAYPVLRHLFPKWTNHDQHLAIYKEMEDFLRNIIQDHRNRMMNSKDKQPTNFIEAFLEEIERNSGNPDSIFTEEQLIVTIEDLFLAGSETTSALFGWTLLYLILHPQVQKKVYDEIYNTVSNDQFLSPRDLDRMPYLQATILEAERLSCFGAIPPARECVQDTTFKKFTIPKGSCVLWNLHPVCMDEDFWGDPNAFRPERFLDETGKNLIKSRTERIAIFGFGKRICIGENLAKDSIFIFLTSLLKAFALEVVPGREPSTADPNNYIIVSPKPYCLKIVPRS